MFSCLSVCVLLSLLSAVCICIAVGSTSLVCAVRSVSKTLAREMTKLRRVDSSRVTREHLGLA